MRIPPLKRALTDKNETVRGVAASALSAFDHPDARAARVAVHRLRKRFRQIYREQISQTLADAADLEAELRHLAAALARE